MHDERFTVPHYNCIFAEFTEISWTNIQGKPLLYSGEEEEKKFKVPASIFIGDAYAAVDGSAWNLVCFNLASIESY